MDPQTQVWVRRSRRGTAESRGGSGRPGGPELCSRWPQRSGPAGGQPCPLHTPSLASGCFSICWPGSSPNHLMPALCSPFSEPSGQPSVLRPSPSALFYVLTLGRLGNTLEESHPSPPPRTCLPLHALFAKWTYLS